MTALVEPKAMTGALTKCSLCGWCLGLGTWWFVFSWVLRVQECGDGWVSRGGLGSPVRSSGEGALEEVEALPADHVSLAELGGELQVDRADVVGEEDGGVLVEQLGLEELANREAATVRSGE